MGEKLIKLYHVIIFCFLICEQSQEINIPTSTVGEKTILIKQRI